MVPHMAVVGAHGEGRVASCAYEVAEAVDLVDQWPAHFFGSIALRTRRHGPSLDYLRLDERSIVRYSHCAASLSGVWLGA